MTYRNNLVFAVVEVVGNIDIHDNLSQKIGILKYDL